MTMAPQPHDPLTVAEPVDAELDYDHPAYEKATIRLTPDRSVFYLYTEQSALGRPLEDGTVRCIYQGQRLRVPLDKLQQFIPAGRR